MEFLIGALLIGAAALYSNKAATGSFFQHAIDVFPASPDTDTRTVSVSFSPSMYDPIYQKHAARTGLPWLLLKAIARIESSENSGAVNRADPSYGLMQILCSGSGDSCSNAFPAIPAFRGASKTKLVNDPDFNVQIGADILKWNLNYTKLGATNAGYRKAIAMYNRWESRRQNDGQWANQAYVDRVWREYQRLAESGALSV
jgi:soluble lytic murein transglycosylase-like protein